MKKSRAFVDRLDRKEWARFEFEQASLGDPRLDERLISMASDFAEQPGAPIAQACGTEAKVKGAFRFLENGFIQPQGILVGHRRAALDRMAREPVILGVSDTTSFNFSHLPNTPGLGSIGRKTFTHQRGLWMHSTQAFTPEGLPLGFIAAQFWSRPLDLKNKAQRQHEPFEQKESVRWRESWQACQAVRAQLPASTVLVNIDDMEGDIYEVFAAALAQPAPRAELLIRSQYDRKLEGQQQRLWAYLAQQPQAGSLTVQVPRQGKQPCRVANLQIRFCEVVLEAPERKRGQPSLRLWAVEAHEVDAPKGSEPILWRLLTTIPVTTAEQAIEKVRWYARRWGIEVHHKILKSVCRAEAHQGESVEGLERRLMIDLIVAWRLQVLTQTGRQNPELPASDYFSPSEWKALCSYIHPRHPLPAQVPALGQMMEWIGRLGGFIKSKSNPHPGTITLARGLMRLNDMAAIWSIQEKLHAKKR